MDQKIILRFHNAGKAGTSVEFPVTQHRTITVGCDPSCEVIYDADRDDLVSRLHSRITVEDGPPAFFTVSDFGTRNGTYVNHQRINGAVTLNPGDIVQLGPGGPEFEFDLIADHNPKTRSNLLMYLGALAASLLLMAGALLSVSIVRDKLSPAAVSKLANESVLFFEVSWKLVDMETGHPLYHLYYENKVAVAPRQYREIVPGGPAHLPVFVTLDGTLEPLLVTDSGHGMNPSIGGRHSGSGFVVSADGFILTTRRVAAAWLSLYGFDSPAGLVLQHDEQGNQKLTPISARQFPRWVPAAARFIPHSGKTLEGRNDYLDVTFPHSREHLQAKLIRISDQADVAMVKIDIPRPLRKLELSGNGAIAQGDPVLVLGYRGGSPDPSLSLGSIAHEAVMSTSGDVYQLAVNSTERGNSGGPVLNDRGRVIGVFSYSAQVDALIACAVPIRYGMELMDTKPAGSFR
ncbi:MAG TPA: trypsin-like peptidase domain-containing protein [Candidatus Acidoferrum sp.]|nr:trypsin-like peptidase domain-containing protein [Candidatus Acidoferrum sp.]